MKLLPGFLLHLAMIGVVAIASDVDGQNLPGMLGFSIDGSFINGTAQSSKSILITDNDLTDGYDAGFDLTDAPAALDPSGPAGSAAFQWGVASDNSNYPHTSSLWFQPLVATNISPEQSFELGYLFYRNGTIKTTTGATWVDLAMTLSFSQPLGIDPISVVFGSELINSVNNSNPTNSADIVSLRDLAAPLDFTDASGNRYFLELTVQVDQDTIDGTLSSQDEFRVFEGGQGRATLLGRFTTTPITPGSPMIPEPSGAALLGAFGMLILIRRRR
jgi:hypothetical protein